MGQVGTGRGKMGRLRTSQSGTGRLRKKLQQTLLLLTGLGPFGMPKWLKHYRKNFLLFLTIYYK
jgi:hypothetical protein